MSVGFLTGDWLAYNPLYEIINVLRGYTSIFIFKLLEVITEAHERRVLHGVSSTSG